MNYFFIIIHRPGNSTPNQEYISLPHQLVSNESGETMIKTMEIVFSGKVQKVGFRACVRNMGQSLGLSGEVENLRDGRVRALVTGDEMLIEKFLSMVYTCPRAIIRETFVNEYVSTEFTGFIIKRE